MLDEKLLNPSYLPNNVAPVGLVTDLHPPFVIAPTNRQEVEENNETLEVQAPSTCHIWGIDFASVNMDETIEHIDRLIEQKRGCQVITANLNYVMLCEKNPRLVDITSRAALTLCDGMPVLWRSKFSSQPLPERVAGADLIYRLCERAALRGHRVYFLGAAEGIAQLAADRLEQRYPGLQVAGVECPPFRKLTSDEETAICERVRKAGTDILLVAFGQPKGEFWIDENQQRLGGAVCIQLGASFDFIAGNSKRAPMWIQKIGLEWLHRMTADPIRLLPRYSRNIACLLRRLRRDILNATSR